MKFQRSSVRPSHTVFYPVRVCLLRKEVIQPQVPLRLPCYDFIPITIHTFGICSLAVGVMTSGTNGFHDVTGGVYKTRERIHGNVADLPLLAIPTSRRRVAACDLNWGRIFEIASTSRYRIPLSTVHCSMFVAQGVRAMLT